MVSFLLSAASGDRSTIEATCFSVCANFSSSRVARRDWSWSNLTHDNAAAVASHSWCVSSCRVASSCMIRVRLAMGTSKVRCWCCCLSIKSNDGAREKGGGVWLRWSECCFASFDMSRIKARLLNWCTESTEWARLSDWDWMRPSWFAINAWTRSGLCEDWVEREGACSSELIIDDGLRLMLSLFRTAWAMLGREGEENIEFEWMSGFNASNDDDDGPAAAAVAAEGCGASWIDSK